MLRPVSMTLRTIFVCGAIVVGAAIVPVPFLSTAQAACEGERVDGTTADSARQKIQKAGYTQVRVNRKGCDSVWHATAMKAGAPVRVLVNPQGQVMEEGD